MTGPDVSTEPTSDDRARVRALLGREPQGRYEIVVRDAARMRELVKAVGLQLR